MNRVVMFTFIGLLVLLLLIQLIPKNVPQKKEIINNNFVVSDNSLNKDIEFLFCNHSLRPLDIYVEWDAEQDLELITQIPPESCKHVHPTSDKFVPGVTLFSKFGEEFAFKPHVLEPEAYVVHFGEVAFDVFRDSVTKSDRNEILSLRIENRSLHPYNIFYRGVFLGKVGAYHPSKDSIEYSFLTNAFGKHFQLGTWLEFRMEGDQKSQFVQLKNKFTTDVVVGDVVSRNENNL